MNELDDLLQLHLVKLEEGEPLDVVLAELPAETAAILAMAAELKQVPLPEPSETAVVAHRAAAVRAAQQQAIAAPPPATAPAAGWLAAFLAWWRGNQALAWSVTAVATVLLVLFLSSLLNRGADTTATVAEQDETSPTQQEQENEPTNDSLLDRLFGPDSEDLAEDTISPSAAEATDSSGSDVAAVEDDPGFQLYLPILVDPLQVGPQTAVLGDLQGVVSVQEPDGGWQQVSYLSSVAAGSRVRTGALSSASLTFFDGSVAKIGPESELSIDTLSAQRPGEGFRTVVLSQWRGDSTHDVQFRNDGGSRYEVQSPSGTGIARGTTFHVLVLPDLTSRYSVLEGRVDVTSINVTVSVLAGQLSTILVDAPPAAPVFQVNGEGEVTAIGETWTIGGQTFATDDQTVIVGNPQVGDWVTVQGHLLDDGSKVADLIVLMRELPQDLFSLTAVVTEMGSEQWLLGDLVVQVDATTAIDPDIEPGDWVRVTGLVQPDGTLLAQQIQLLFVEGLPFEFTGVVQAMEPELWQISGIAVVVDGRTEIKDDPAVGDIVKVEGVITPEGLWLAHEIKDDDDAAIFEFTGLVETIDPWLVAGIALVTDEWTEIDTAVEPGSLVNVEGIILPDGTWLAEEIKLLDEALTDETIIRFMGILESMDPWVVNGISLIATDESRLTDGLILGSVVQVTARWTDDNGWEILWIRPLLPPTTGCFTVHTRVTVVNGTQITLVNWPSLTLGDDVQIEGTLVPNSIISVQICLTGDVTLVTHIVVIQIIVNVTDSGSNPGSGGNQGGDLPPGGKVTICHYPPGNPNARHTITVDWAAWVNAHSGHGDTLGPCP